VIGGSSYRNVGKERSSGGDFSSFSLLLECQSAAICHNLPTERYP
jgi:hypothetical protein